MYKFKLHSQKIESESELQLKMLEKTNCANLILQAQEKVKQLCLKMIEQGCAVQDIARVAATMLENR